MENIQIELTLIELQVIINSLDKTIEENTNYDVDIMEEWFSENEESQEIKDMHKKRFEAVLLKNKLLNL